MSLIMNSLGFSGTQNIPDVDFHVKGKHKL
jgi:hypothetical protein